LLINGPYFLGYYKNPELTKAKVDSEGWMHTGDILQFNVDGTISILGRVGNVVKNSLVFL